MRKGGCEEENVRMFGGGCEEKDGEIVYWKVRRKKQ